MKTDPGEKPYPCAQCKKIFTSNGHLKQHLSNHSSCGFWLYSFVFISVSASLVWTCDIENVTRPQILYRMVFSREESLKLHLRIHTDPPSVLTQYSLTAMEGSSAQNPFHGVHYS